MGICEKEDASETPKSKDGKLKGIYPWGRQWPPPNGAGNYAGEESHLRMARKVAGMTWGVIEAYRDGAARTSRVGQYQANANGIFDLGGNVQEWCQDKYTPGESWRVL